MCSSSVSSDLLGTCSTGLWDTYSADPRLGSPTVIHPQNVLRITPQLPQRDTVSPACYSVTLGSMQPRDSVAGVWDCATCSGEHGTQKIDKGEGHRNKGERECWGTCQAMETQVWITSTHGVNKVILLVPGPSNQPRTD